MELFITLILYISYSDLTASVKKSGNFFSASELENQTSRGVLTAGFVAFFTCTSKYLKVLGCF